MQPQTNPKPGNTLNGASRGVDVVIDPYGALGIVALRDWPLRSAATTELFIFTGRVQDRRAVEGAGPYSAHSIAQCGNGRGTGSEAAGKFTK